MKRLLLSGGGTGGHIYPALSIAREVKKRYPDVEIAYIGTENGLESKIVPKEKHIRFYPVEVQGLKRKISWSTVGVLIKFIKAVKTSREYLREFKPDVVIGTGGYVSGPALFSAYQLRIPTLIHEQNVIPGLTTKFLARFADIVAISFKESQKYLKKSRRIVVTGNPRASEVVQAADTGEINICEEKRKSILIFGGSRGAKAINNAVLQMLPYIKNRDIQVIYITGESHYEAIRSQIDLKEYSNLEVVPFMYNMPTVLAESYLVISRAGASSIAEITSLGLPSILIPSPHVTNNHQEINARWLQKRGAAELIMEKDCTGERLWKAVDDLIAHPDKHHSMSVASRKIGYPEAAEVLVNELEKMLLVHR